MATAFDVAIASRDAKRLSEFYASALGLELAGEVAVSGVLPNARLFRMRAGDSVLKILQFDDPPAENSCQTEIAAATGLRYFTLSVSNLSERLSAAQTLGAEVVLPATQLGGGDKGGVTIAFVRDPDGNFVELVERED